MSLRISQRPTDDIGTYYVEVTVKRGGVLVAVADQMRWMPVNSGIGFVAWEFVMPTPIPSSGAWTFECPILSEFLPQDFGTVSVLGLIYNAHLDTGVITTTAGSTIVAGGKISIRGMVT